MCQEKALKLSFWSKPQSLMRVTIYFSHKPLNLILRYLRSTFGIRHHRAHSRQTICGSRLTYDPVKSKVACCCSKQIVCKCSERHHHFNAFASAGLLLDGSRSVEAYASISPLLQTSDDLPLKSKQWGKPTTCPVVSAHPNQYNTMVSALSILFLSSLLPRQITVRPDSFNPSKSPYFRSSKLSIL